PPSDGVRRRGLYLHYGLVPIRGERLESEEKRSKVFYRGYDVYNPVNAGFIISRAEAESLGFSGAEVERLGWKLDVRERGNGNQGHIYGATLAPDDKRALLEYLKTR